MANKKTIPHEAKSTVLDFEKSLSKLESIVKQMEDGQLTLEEALKRFEEGVALARQCQTALINAEQRVKTLLLDNAPEAEGSQGS